MCNIYNNGHTQMSQFALNIFVFVCCMVFMQFVYEDHDKFIKLKKENEYKQLINLLTFCSVNIIFCAILFFIRLLVSSDPNEKCKPSEKTDFEKLVKKMKNMLYNNISKEIVWLMRGLFHIFTSCL